MILIPTNVKQQMWNFLWLLIVCRIMNCKKCNGENVIKYWTSIRNTQRFFCHDCNSTFSFGWLKKTYSQNFIDSVIDEYCHKHKTAKEVINKHKISSRTLIKWKHKHQEKCNQCNQ